MNKRLKKKIDNNGKTLKQKLRIAKLRNSQLEDINATLYETIFTLRDKAEKVGKSNAILANDLGRAVKEIKLLNEEINSIKPWWKKVLKVD